MKELVAGAEMIISCYPKEKEKIADRTKMSCASDDVVKEQVVK